VELYEMAEKRHRKVDIYYPQYNEEYASSNVKERWSHRYSLLADKSTRIRQNWCISSSGKWASKISKLSNIICTQVIEVLSFWDITASESREYIRSKKASQLLPK
jgi:hypothetical protein